MRKFTVYYSLMGEMCSLDQVDAEKVEKSIKEEDREHFKNWQRFATRGDCMKLRNAAVLCLSPKILSQNDKVLRRKQLSEYERFSARPRRSVSI